MAKKASRVTIQHCEGLIRKSIDELRAQLEQYGAQISDETGVNAVFEALKDLNVLGNDPIDPFTLDLAQWTLMSSLRPLGNDPIDPFKLDDFKTLALEVLGNDPIDPFKLDLLIRIGLKTRESLVAQSRKQKPAKKAAKKAKKKKK